VQFAEEVQQPEADAVVDVAGGLVGQEQSGPGDHRAGDGDPLLLTAGEGGRQGGEMLLQADPGQELLGVPPDLRAPLACDTQGQGHVLHRGEVVQQAEILEHHADLAAHERPLGAGQIRHVPSEQGDSAAARALGQIDQAQERRLAGPAWTEKVMERPGLQVKRQAAQNLRTRIIAKRDVLEANHGACVPFSIAPREWHRARRHVKLPAS
jgi:hypothetical protein